MRIAAVLFLKTSNGISNNTAKGKSQYGSVKQVLLLVLVRAGGLCNTSGDFSR
jgi:hypothetical protein